MAVDFRDENTPPACTELDVLQIDDPHLKLAMFNKIQPDLFLLVGILMLNQVYLMDLKHKSIGLEAT